MCPLNPKAEEWRPSPPQPPPPPQNLLPALLFHPRSNLSKAPPPPPQAQLQPSHLFYYWNPRQAHHYFCYGSVPSNLDQLKAAEATAPPICSAEAVDDMKSPTMSPRKITRELGKKGLKKAVPPRRWKPARLITRHNKPPAPQPKQECQSKTSAESVPENTTIMIKNIPNRLRRDFMLDFLDGYCNVHCLEYDFLYLPMDFRKKNNLGYAFVNFTTAAAASKVKMILHNYKWGVIYAGDERIFSKKICAITWARIQGKQL